MPGWPLHLVQIVAAAIVVAGPVPLALSLVRRWGDRTHRAVENLLAGIVIAVSLQLLVGLALGFTGLFLAPALVGAEAILFAAGWRELRRTGWPRLWPDAGSSAIESGAVTVVAIAGFLGLGEIVLHTTSNFDSLAYHLPVMARWVSSGRLEVFAALGQVALYPSHWELLAAMLVPPVGQDLLISVPNLLAWTQLGLAIVLVATRLGARRDAAMVGAALVLTAPAVLGRLDAIQPDIALAATFLTALGFALRSEQGGRRLDAVVVLLALGIMPGLKLSGPLLILLLLPALVLAPGFRLRDVRALRDRYPLDRVAGVALAAALVLAGSWYLRNAVALGNPLGDLRLEFLGSTLFDGSISRDELQRGALVNVFRPGEIADWKILGAVLLDELGAGVALLALLLPVGLFRGGQPGSGRARLATLVLLAATVLLYWNTPYSGDNGTHGWRVTPWIEVGLRYGFVALALGGALGAVGLSAHPRLPWAGLAVLVVTALLAVPLQWSSGISLLLPAVALGWATGALLLGRRPPRSAGVAIGAALVLAAIVGTGVARQDREVRRAEAFGDIVTALTGELGTRDVVAVVNTQKLHLAAGTDWRRRVVLPELPAPGEEGQWVRGLREAGVTAVLVGHQPPAPEEEAAVRRVQAFLRQSAEFEIVLDYESLAKDLALFRLLPQSSR